MKTSFTRVLINPTTTDQPTTDAPTHQRNNHRPNRQDAILKTLSMKNNHLTEHKHSWEDVKFFGLFEE